jgi:DNA-binding NtrC family response regulator
VAIRGCEEGAGRAPGNLRAWRKSRAALQSFERQRVGWRSKQKNSRGPKGEVTMDWPPQILILAPESSERNKLQRIISHCAASVFCCSTLLEAQSFLSGQLVNAVFAQNPLPDGDLSAVLADVHRYQSKVPVVALLDGANWDQYEEVMRAGAFDYLAFPPGTLEVKRVLWSALHAFSTERREHGVAA